MITEQQRIDRGLGIGGSDIAAILGVSDYKTPYMLWLEKTGQLPEKPGTEAMTWGNKLEPVIIDEFRNRNDLDVSQPDTIVHPLYDYMRGNLDGFIESQNAVLEVKVVGSYAQKNWEDGIPSQYLAQVGYYCMLTNADRAFVAVLFGGNQYKQYVYERDIPFELYILDKVKNFWKSVQDRMHPGLYNTADVKIKFAKSTQDKSVSVTKETLKSVDKLADIKARIKALEAEEERQRFEVMKLMGDAEVLTDSGGNTMATWKSTKRGTRMFVLKDA